VNYQEDAKIVELAGREQSKNGVESVEEERASVADQMRDLT